MPYPWGCGLTLVLAVVWMGVAMATDVVQCCSVGMWVACQLAKPSVSSLGHNAAMFTTVGPSPHPLGAMLSPAYPCKQGDVSASACGSVGNDGVHVHKYQAIAGIQ